jgi:hypothetical protein
MVSGEMRNVTHITSGPVPLPHLEQGPEGLPHWADAGTRHAEA